MKVEILGAYGGSTDTTFLTSFLIDDFLAVDAGSLTQTLSLERQAALRHILISHSHLDHTLSLPFLADNLFGMLDAPLQVYATQTVVDGIKSHIFNEVTWPDFSVLPSPEKPTIAFNVVGSESTFSVNGYTVVAVPVNHIVPTSAFLITNPEATSSVLYTADTCNTDRVWEIANACPTLKAVIVDCSFPNDMKDLAQMSGHLTPELLAEDLKKLKVECDVLVYHLKPHFRELLLSQLSELKIDRLVTSIQSRQFNYL